MVKFNLKSIKQLFYPAEFRLPEPEFSEDQLALMEELIQLIQPKVESLTTENQDEKIQMARFLIQLATGIWRVRRRIEGLKRLPKELQEALFSLESMWSSMAASGVSVIDHVGESPSVSGGPRVVEVRLVPGLDREQVIETVLPTVFLHGQVVQVGEVVVGRPEDKAGGGV